MNDDNNDKLSSLKIIYTENMLTMEEVQELKRMATASKLMRYLFTFFLAILSVVGFPTAMSWLSKHFN